MGSSEGLPLEGLLKEAASSCCLELVKEAFLAVKAFQQCSM